MNFTRLDGRKLRDTVIGTLIPVAAKVRDLAPRLGLRRYELFRVLIRWSGDRRGEGVAEILEDTVLLPTPRVLFAGGSYNQDLAGLMEVGSAVVTGLNGEYKADYLEGKDTEGEPVQPNVELFYEVRHLNDDGSDGDRDRYTLAAPPEFIVGALGWTLRLGRQQGDRTRAGTPHEGGRVW